MDNTYQHKHDKQYNKTLAQLRAEFDRLRHSDDEFCREYRGTHSEFERWRDKNYNLIVDVKFAPLILLPLDTMLGEVRNDISIENIIAEQEIVIENNQRNTKPILESYLKQYDSLLISIRQTIKTYCILFGGVYDTHLDSVKDFHILLDALDKLGK